MLVPPTVATVLALLSCAVAAPLRPQQHALLRDPFERRLIALADSDPRWLSENEIFELYRSGVKFIDVTDGDYDLLGHYATAPGADGKLMPPKSFPAKVAFHDQILPIIEKISMKDMKEFLTKFTAFRTRYYRSSTGAESAQWLFDRVQDLAKMHGRNNISLTVTKFTHPWNQFSVIARLEAGGGDDGSRRDQATAGQEIVVISAHQDSVNQMNPWFGRSPGADDDGSGTTTIFEALTRLVHSDFTPKRPIEFHWYSAEEGGLLGSQKVVASYMKSGINVYANFHNDMTGAPPADKDRVIGIVTDNVNAKLTNFLEIVVDAYCTVPWAHTKCGYACSDHATWTKAGVPSVMAFESEFDDHAPYIHTSQDTVDRINFEHVSDFVRASIGFAVELSLSEA